MEENTDLLKETTENTTPDTSMSPKPKKGKKGIIAGITVLCVVAVAGAVTFTNTAEYVVNKTALATAQALTQREGVYSKIKDSFTADFFTTHAYEQELDLKLNSIDSADNNTDMLNNVGLKVNTQADIQNKKTTGNLSVTYQNIPIINTDIFINENQWFVKIPILYDAWFSGNNKNIMEQYSNSPLNKNGDFEYDPNSDISIDPFNGNIKLLADLFKDTAVLYNNITYDKLDESLNENNTTYKGYSATVPGEDIKAYFTSVADKLNSPENNNVTQILNKTYGIDTDLLTQDLEKLSFSDTTFKIFTNKKLIYCVDFDVNYNYDSSETKFNVKIKYSGDTLEITLDNYNNSIITIKDTIEIASDCITQSDYISFNNNGDISDFNISTALNNTALTVKGNITSNNTELINIDATGSAVLNENNVKIDLENIKLIADEETANMSGNYYMGELTKEISDPQGEVITIFEESEEKLNQIQTEIQSKLYSLIYSLY